jgi:hypothetical protein
MRNLRLRQLRSAAGIFDLEDRFARERGVHGTHPRPIGKVKYWLVGRVVDGTREAFATPIQLLTVRNPSGYDLFFDRVHQRTSAISRLDLTPGTYLLRIETQFYQTREFTVTLPLSDSPHSIDLEPDYRYPFPPASMSNIGSPTLLRGTVYGADGEGLENVAIAAIGGSNDYVTDVTGQWVLVFPEDQTTGDVELRFTLPDASIVDVPSVTVVQGQASSLIQAGLRGRVVDGAGLGIARASVQVAGHAGETLTTDDGIWWFYFGLNQPDELVSVSAGLPDGRTLTEQNVQVRFRSVEQGPFFSFQ